MHATLIALGSLGDVLPYAALGSRLREAGHQVRLVTFESFARLAAQNELELYPIRGDAQALVANAGADLLALVRSFSSLARSYARDLSPAQLGETDLIINQLPAGLFGFDLAEKYHIPMILAAVIPMARTSAFPLMGFPRVWLPGYNQATYRLGEQLVWQMFRSVINRWRAQTLDLPAHSFGGYLSQLGTRKFPILNGFSRFVVQRPVDWNAHIHITGYWFPEDRSWQPPEALQSFIEAGSPPIFFGFGSMPVKDIAKTTQMILDALKQTGQRGILHAGWGGIGDQALPDNVYKVDYAPYSWLFPRMGMVFHHGGSGSTAFGLRSGVPSCAVPFIFDQRFWGERIAALKVGPKPIPYRVLSKARLVEAVERSVRDSVMRQKAVELGSQIQAENGLDNALRIIESAVRQRA